ncbi:GNAT domain [Sesbania bispinosa]|nr:GNAT domain [Sesbania bispinosa]
MNMMEGAPIYSKSDAKEEYVDLTQISLRPIDLSDVDDLMLWTTDEKVARYCTWEPYTSKEDGINFIQNIASKALWFRAICLRDRAIGCIDFFSCSGQRKCRDKSAELGYALSSIYWNKGIATQVVKQVVEVAFGEFPHLERLEALVDVENVASQRVLEKAGFQKEGVLRKYLFIKGKSRDMVMFSILPNDRQI